MFSPKERIRTLETSIRADKKTIKKIKKGSLVRCLKERVAYYEEMMEEIKDGMED